MADEYAFASKSALKLKGVEAPIKKKKKKKDKDREKDKVEKSFEIVRQNLFSYHVHQGNRTHRDVLMSLTPSLLFPIRLTL